MLCPNPSHNDPNTNNQAYITQATDSNYRIVFCPVCHYQVWLKHYNYSLTKQYATHTQTTSRSSK